MVFDNASRYKTLVHDWLTKRPRWDLHFTPTSASWLNLVECWFLIRTRRCLQRGTFASTNSLKAAMPGSNPPTRSSSALNASANAL
ncbi:MAG: hypothetical protein EOS20_33665 [Mesorhizobium sp.]|nr:hypothetical protein EOA28_21400 [Mesorhizobium sp. M2A.F.Ca.ET.067.02.1.1]RWB85731.1 MAG: hypothetical protein EOQ51_15705 [Mesorhizobium sp.]TGP98917.1 hypothetical protein EN861_08880 [Mesorhizobium sp. M8A.F.Ca.ET.218.01.1.1]TGS41978.1 hypothetical protein EN825_21355 [Mesorhizobium sp. M8A.F.Ca.ET.182.01.1.1]TGS79658.1 hypothetical protein EN824_18770 [Mesorhizobium sp. M8A.F.Ca.ET.181.01.1.1]TGT20260.1 hypothetical protein EN856_08890 [Mesorhizobium sp. M8A.F.Ca.ET.213.01.1.1]TGU8846